MSSLLGESKGRGGVTKAATWGFGRADFKLFRMLVGRIPWELVLKGRDVQEDWTFFRKEILKVQ